MGSAAEGLRRGFVQSDIYPSEDKSDEIRFKNGDQEIHQMQRLPAPDKFGEDQFVFPSPFDEGSRGRNDAVSGAIESIESKIGLTLQPSVALFHSRKGLAPSFSDEVVLLCSLSVQVSVYSSGIFGTPVEVVVC